jgi:hypothetical protein
MTEQEKLADQTGPRNRRPSTEVDKERAETYLKSLKLEEKVALVKTLKESIFQEVKSLTEASRTAESITNGL